jgi:superfamily II DNA or RNA helicase
MSRGQRVVVQAPTGAGKTLIAFVAIAIAAAKKGRWRGLMSVPSRPLLRQHVVDAGWLRQRVPLQFVVPQDATPIWRAALDSPRGLICTTPHSLKNRLSRLGGLEAFPPWDVAMFDEIDVFVTKELDGRKDIWPLVAQCAEANVPMIGFTGTVLNDDQAEYWQENGFVAYRPDIDEHWLPFTRVWFIGITNQRVQAADERIRQDLGRAYDRFRDEGGNPRSWKQITNEARRAGALGDAARSILALHSDRLQLFEGGDDVGGKVTAMCDWLSHRTALVLCRYVETAVSVARHLASAGITAVQADGTMRAAEVERRATLFRRGGADALVMTRDLGGRGLDFPQADSVLLLSPRSNYQTVAQELARIRSRRSITKDTAVLFYERTAETAKASRLAEHLIHRNRYGDMKLFDVVNAPEPIDLDPFDRQHLYLEETRGDL